MRTDYTTITPNSQVRSSGAPCRDDAATILLVDDEEAVRKVASLALRRHGYTVIEANDGDMAACILAAPATPRIDLLLSDIRMTGAIDGHGLALLFWGTFPDAPVILMSGAEPNDHPIDTRLSYIGKPFTIHSLPAEVCKAIEVAAFRCSE